MTPVHPGSGSTVRRILLGSQLRRLREAKGITREAAGYAIRSSESKISRVELGRVSFKERDVADLLTLYGITGESDRSVLLALAREANVAGWWHSYADVLPSWFHTYVGLEESASPIRAFEVQFVHGLLQSADYTRAVTELGHPEENAAQIERRVTLRLERQKLLASERAPYFSAVMDEAALRRPFGGREVMRGQLQYLMDVAERPNVTVQLLPFAVGGHSAGSGAFTLLRFPESDLQDVAYVEQLTGAMYIDKREEVEQYDKAMRKLCDLALSPEGTLDWLRSALREL